MIVMDNHGLIFHMEMSQKDTSTNIKNRNTSNRPPESTANPSLKSIIQDLDILYTYPVHIPTSAKMSIIQALKVCRHARSLQAQQAVLSQYATLEEAAKQRLTAEAEDPTLGKILLPAYILKMIYYLCVYTYNYIIYNITSMTSILIHH